MVVTLSDHRAEIELACDVQMLDPNMVEGLVLVESSDCPFAWNPEPRYRFMWNVKTNKPFRPLSINETLSKFPPGDFKSIVGDADQEWWSQQASWGLMQIMGAVARERGCVVPFLPELCDVETNLAWGTRHLAHLLEWADGNDAKALGAYNAGMGGWSSPVGRAYAAKVIAKIAEVQGARR